MRAMVWMPLVGLLALGCDPEPKKDPKNTVDSEADAGADQQTLPCTAVALEGVGEDGEVLWSVVSAPDGAVMGFDDETSATPTFRANLQGTYVLELEADGATDEVEVVVDLVVDTPADDEADDDLMSLREAISLAQSCAGPHTISVALDEHIVLSDTLVVEDPLGEDNDLTIRGTEVGAAVAGSGGRLFVVNEVFLTVETLDILDGVAPDSDSGGGFLLGEGADLTLRSLELKNHRSDSILYGGAAVMGRFGHMVSFENVVASDNRSDLGGAVAHVVGDVSVETGQFYDNATDGFGGALHVEGDLDVLSTVFSGNQAKRGAAAWVDSGNVSLESVEMAENTATELGGGLMVSHDTYSDEVTLDVATSVFRENTAASGGGIYADTYVTLTVEDSQFSGNSTEEYGGAVDAGWVATFRDSTFSENTAGSWGGAIANHGLTNLHSLLIEDGVFEDNTAGEEGGAIFEVFAASVSIAGSGFSGNSAGARGGAISSSPVGSTELANSTVEDNSAGQYGGGIAFTGTTLDYPDTNTSNLVLVDTTVSGNSTGGFGGGVYSLIGDVLLSGNSSVTNNVASGPSNPGGGVCNDGGWVVGESQVSANPSGDFCDDDRTQ